MSETSILSNRYVVLKVGLLFLWGEVLDGDLSSPCVCMDLVGLDEGPGSSWRLLAEGVEEAEPLYPNCHSGEGTRALFPGLSESPVSHANLHRPDNPVAVWKGLGDPGEAETRGPVLAVVPELDDVSLGQVGLDRVPLGGRHAL